MQHPFDIYEYFQHIPPQISLKTCTEMVDEYIHCGGNLNKRIPRNIMMRTEEWSLVGNFSLSPNMRKAIYLHPSVDCMSIARCVSTLEGKLHLTSALLCIVGDRLFVTTKWLKDVPLRFFFKKPEETFIDSHGTKKTEKAGSVFEALIRGDFTGFREEIQTLLWERFLQESNWEELRQYWVPSVLQAEQQWRHRETSCDISYGGSCDALKALCFVLRHAHTLDDLFQQWSNNVYKLIAQFFIPALTKLVQSYVTEDQLYAPLLRPVIERQISNIQSHAPRYRTKIVLTRLNTSGRNFVYGISPSRKRITIVTDW
jgi:hypothetical protein